MTTPDSVLIRQARDALAAASVMETGDVELLVEAVDEPKPSRGPVLLLDCNGQPRFVCEPGSPVAHAAALARPALLTIGQDAGGLPRSVSFVGHLERLPDQLGAAIVSLTVAVVVVEAVDQPRCSVSLSSYVHGEAVSA